MNREIVVVGAGPAGLITAREVAKRGVNVLILEEHEEIGVPCHCAGLLSISGLTEIGTPLEAGFVKNRLRGARFYSPSGLSFTVERKEAVACVVDRTVFDKFLARQAARAGADIRPNSKVQQIKRCNGQIIARGSWGAVKADVVVDAEGVGSRFVKEMGLTPLDSECTLPAIQFELTNVDVDPEYVEIHVGKKIAPGFFAWVIPLNGVSARVGLACKKVNPRKMLDRFIQNRFSKFERVSIQYGRTVTCGPISRTFNDNFVVVGDAAGQVKPTTGGGVILGGMCASIAAEVVVEAVRKRTFSSRFLRMYEELWKKKLLKEFKVMRFARKVTNRVSDKTIDKIFRTILEKNLVPELSSKGEMDFQSNILLAIVTKMNLKILVSVVPEFLRFKDYGLLSKLLNEKKLLER